MTTSAAAIVPITLTINDRTGLTLYAPPWEDEDGEEWQGFLGDGAKILLFPTTADLAAFIASGEENDLSDHPGYGAILKATPDDLRPDPADRYDLDAVYELAGDEPDPVHVSKLANIVDMVGRIADCCDDGKLRSLLGSAPYAELVDEDVSYQGRDGRKRWTELGDTIADSWERALRRVEDWLRWEGDFSSTEFDEDETEWERIGAEPIRIVLADAEYLTVRGSVLVDPDAASEETAVEFLGGDGRVTVFTEVADLAQFCREAKEHRLVKLEWWSEVAELDDEAFEPETTIDLRKPSSQGAELLRELAAFCDLSADTEVLDRPSVDKTDWADLVDEVRSCFVEG